MLERGEALALAADERAQGLVLFVIRSDDVEAVRLAGLDDDVHVEAECSMSWVRIVSPAASAAGEAFRGLELPHAHG